MSILQQNYIDVKNKADGFSLAGKDRATLESDLSVPASPQGQAQSAFCIFGGKLSQGLTDTSCGVISDKLNVPLIVEFCNLDSHCPNEDYSTRLDTCKQVGIYNTYNNSCNHYYDDLYHISHGGPPLRLVGRSVSTCNGKIKSLPIRDPSPDWFKKFGDLRDHREKLADVLAEAGRYKEARSVRNCGENFIAFKAFCCGDTVVHPMSCCHRLCPVCMIRRSAKLAVKVGKFIMKMKRPKHIVLTVENVSKIDKAYFSWLRRCFVKLRHRHVFSKCIGGFYSIETTYNSEKKSWHVHIHIVVDVPYIPKQELVDEWKDITEGSFIVDIKQIGKDQSPLEASREVAKYVVKPGDFLQDPSLVDGYLKAVKGSRLVSTFGKYYKMVLDDDDGGLPDCWCGRNNWRRLDVFYSVTNVFKDTQGFYRLKTIISDG